MQVHFINLQIPTRILIVFKQRRMEIVKHWLGKRYNYKDLLTK